MAQVLKAKVKNGRIHLDEPTKLPNGTVLELVERDEFAYLDRESFLSDDDRAELDGAIDEAASEIMHHGEIQSVDNVVAILRSKR